MIFKQFNKSGFKKRYVVFGLLAMELASLPAAAKIIESVVFSVDPTASVVLIDSVAGQTRYAVASNAPFHVSVDGVIGDISVAIHKSGEIGTSRFGDNAQMPGVALICAALNGQKRVVYRAERKTTLNAGDILSQAVIVSVNYDETADPNIMIDVGSPQYPVANSTPCKSKIV